MRSLHTGCIVALGLISLAPAQPPVTQGQPSNKQSISVRGCIKGQTIIQTAGEFAPNGTTYRLRGPKSVTASLKEHNGHDDEIQGTTQIADDRKSKVTKEKRIGKNRIYGSASAEEHTGTELPDDRWIDVVSITHVNSTCGGK
jgi:hypothetical protein